MYQFGEYDEFPALMDEDEPIAVFAYDKNSMDEIDAMIKALNEVKAQIQAKL